MRTLADFNAYFANLQPPHRYAEDAPSCNERQHTRTAWRPEAKHDFQQEMNSARINELTRKQAI